jgi:hypothetical protein
MRLKLLYLGIATTISLSFFILKADNNKVDLCHVPPGNPENAHTINIALPAVTAHLALHSDDYLGKCSEVEPYR